MAEGRGLEPAFIVGCGSSGTHLLGNLLDRHSLLACGPELWAFNHPALFGDFETVRRKIGTWLQRGLYTDWIMGISMFFNNLHAYFTTGEQVEKLAREAPDLRSFFEAFFAPWLERRGKRMWIEKTLSNFTCLRQILELFPEARIIHMVRDGRDTICSLLRRGYASSFQCAARWVYDSAGAAAWHEDSRYLLVRYEDLVSDPEAEMVRVVAHLGVDFEGAVLTGSEESQQYWRRFGKFHDSWTTDPLAGISSESVGRYREELEPGDEAVFWRVRLRARARRKLGAPADGAAGLMNLFGYPDSPERPLPPVPRGSRRIALKAYWKRMMWELRYHRRFYWPATAI